MKFFVDCPHCGKEFSVEVKDPDPRMLKPRIDGLRKVTSEDRKVILSHHLNGWRGISKHQLAGQLGLSVSQIAAVCAWTHPNLGGERYFQKHAGANNHI